MHAQMNHITPKKPIEMVLKLIDEICQRDSKFQQMYQRSIDVIDRAIDLYTIKGICLSFNGGKDSTIVFHLIRIVLAKRILKEMKSMDMKSNTLDDEIEKHLQQMPIMYFDTQDQFKQVEEFVEEISHKYNFKYHLFNCTYIEGLKQMYEKGIVKGIWMGVRRGDPYTQELEHFTPTSKGWPNFMRINPILKWDYEAVWTFLRDCGLDYCCLYDEGYTSLGNVHNTIKNPALWRRNSVNDQEDFYAPAYELKDVTLERAGRMKKSSESSGSNLKDSSKQSNSTSMNH